MEYQPLTAVWEVTMGCNMRCGHCGSSCNEPLPNELTTEEALSLIDEIGELKLKWITISGGEPLTRKDLPELIKHLNDNSVIVNVITNGWLLSRETAAALKESGISTLAISVDGTKEIHDSIRREGSYERIIQGFKHIQEIGITSGAITTISKKNIDILPQMRRELIDMGVNIWQIQIGLPMGNLAKQPDWVIEPQQVDELIDFCYETSMQDEIKIFPADCIGYYTKKEMHIRQIAYQSANVPVWDGCNAGVRSFGILHNGDILGCTSIRNAEYIEGNIREKKLSDIWNDPNGFAWRRKMKKTDLGGDCAICVYGGKCLGGCPNTRLTMNGKITSENCYCAYNLAVKRLRESLSEKADASQLISQAQEKINHGKFQEVALLTERVLALQPDNTDAWNLKGYAEYMCGNYSLCEEANLKALEINPGNTYAMKGLGLSLHKQGHSEQGLRYLEEAAKLTNYSDNDILNDLNVVKNEMEKK